MGWITQPRVDIEGCHLATSSLENPWDSWVLFIRAFIMVRSLCNVNMALFQWIWFLRDLKTRDSIAKRVSSFRKLAWPRVTMDWSIARLGYLPDFKWPLGYSFLIGLYSLWSPWEKGNCAIQDFAKSCFTRPKILLIILDQKYPTYGDQLRTKWVMSHSSSVV